MYFVARANTGGPPRGLAHGERVRVRLRNGRVDEDRWENFTWDLDIGNAAIESYWVNEEIIGWEPPIINNGHAAPIFAEGMHVKVLLRNGRYMEGPVHYFSFEDGLGGNVIVSYQMPIVERSGPVDPRPADMPTIDTLLKKKKKAGPTAMERMSRCLPDGFLWGDELSPEVLDQILNKYRQTEW